MRRCPASGTTSVVDDDQIDAASLSAGAGKSHVGARADDRLSALPPVSYRQDPTIDIDGRPRDVARTIG